MSPFMANTKSARKNIRKNRTRTLQNQAVKSRLKTLEKKFKASLGSGNVEEAREASKLFVSALDKAVKKSLVHRNKVARKKASCAKAISDMQGGKTEVAPAAVEAPQDDDE